MSAALPPLTGTDMALARQAREWARTGAARLMRVGAGVGIEDMAVAIGCSASALNRWERGTTLPRARHAAAWARILGEVGQAAYHASSERGQIPDDDETGRRAT